MDIRIQTLVLDNFKCHRHLELDFRGGNASVYGDNATGKTSVYDALTWLLFSKDSQGNGEKNMEIKPLNDNGEVADHDALTAVEAVLRVDGEEIRLRRTYKEVWATKRGSSEATYEGNTSEYFVDGVPCKKNAFQYKVGEIISEETFRLLTSVSYFAAGISWQDRRAVLFDISGALDDTAIMATNERFQPLLDSLGRMTLDDYRKKLNAEKKNFTVTKSELPARISECQKTINDIEGIDFLDARNKAQMLQEQVNALAAQILAAEKNDGVRNKELELREAQLEESGLIQRNDNYRQNQRMGWPDLAKLRGSLTHLEGQARSKETMIQRERAYISQLEGLIDQCRRNWIAINNDRFQNDHCPTCGQALPPEQQAKAREIFDRDKERRLKEQVDTSAQHKQSLAAAQERIAAFEKEAQALQQQIVDKKGEIAQAEQGQTPVTDMPDFQSQMDAVQEKIRRISGELMDMKTSAAAYTAGLRAKKREAEKLLAEVQGTLAQEGVLNYSRNRMEQLRLDARNAAAALEAIEQTLSLIEDYTRYKVSFVEDGINSLFRVARFRLFREQANGGIEDRCDVTYHGVPYASVNNGMKINLGIDIINTLSRHYGVRVPLFIDNAESVTRLETCGSQIIRLVVSENDKELRINYEN